MKKNKKLANKRVKTSTKRLAHALNLIQIASRDMKWACANQRWFDGVCGEMDEAATLLGYTLATLVRWDDEKASEEEL